MKKILFLILLIIGILFSLTFPAFPKEVIIGIPVTMTGELTVLYVDDFDQRVGGGGGQKAKDLAVKIYKISMSGVLGQDFGLRDQIRRSAVSIVSNLAEGDERGTDKESIRFFYIAKGSLAELRTQIQIAYEIGYFEGELYETIDAECNELGWMIGKLIKVRKGSKEERQ